MIASRGAPNKAFIAKHEPEDENNDDDEYDLDSNVSIYARDEYYHDRVLRFQQPSDERGESSLSNDSYSTAPSAKRMAVTSHGQLLSSSLTLGSVSSSTSRSNYSTNSASVVVPSSSTQLTIVSLI